MIRNNRLTVFILCLLCAGWADGAETRPSPADIKKVDSLNEFAFREKRFDVAKALNNLFVSENLAATSGYQKGLAISYFYEAGIFHQNGYDKRAISTYYKSKQLFQAIRDTLHIALVNKEIATSLHADGQSAEAERLYNESLAVFLQLHDVKQVANTKNNIGALELDQNRLAKAEMDIREALSLSIGIKHAYGEKKAYYNLGLLAEKKGNFAQAEKWYNRSLAIDLVQVDKYGEALNYLQLASLRLKQNQVEASIAEARKAYQAAQVVSAYNLLSDAASRIIEGYRSKSDNIKAAQWQDSMVKILRTQNRNEKEYALNFIDVIKNQDMRNSDAEKNLEKQKVVQKEQLLIITVGTFILIIVAVLAVLALVNYQRQRFFGKELKQKNEIIEKNSASLDALNKEISSQNMMLEEDNRTKNKLLSIISHDLRTPLVNTKGVLNLVNQGMVPPEEADRLLQLLETQYIGTTSLLDNLLFWIKGQMEGQSVEKVKIGLHNLVKSLEEEQRLPLTKKKIQVINNVDKNISIVTEKEMIRIVCRNLISNAIKFTNTNGTIELNSKVQDGILYLTVKDSGIGMSREAIEKVNTKQYYNTTGTSFEKGSGFGLMLCRDLIEKEGGELLIESEVGKGSSFIIKLPFSNNGVEPA